MSAPTLQNLLEQKAELERQQAELDKLLAASRKEQRAEVIAKIKALLAEHGLSVQDIGFTNKAVKRAPGTKAGKTVAPKYRDPASGATWTGRGLQPRWIKDALAKGEPITKFQI